MTVVDNHAKILIQTHLIQYVSISLQEKKLLAR